MGVSLLALAAPMSAMAQTAPDAGPQVASTDDETIVVNARRRDESIQDVPAVVNAVTSDTVQKLNLREFNEIQTLVPGLSLTNNANGIGGNAQLRGVNFDINASGNNPTVEFYQNDAPITAGVVLQQMYDVGQIEVLRGPQGTLRGRASPSGSITVTTRKPDLYEAGATVNATGNNVGTINVNGGIGIPIIEGVAAIRVAGLIDEGNLNRVRTINPGLEGRDPYGRTASGRISALVQPFDALRLEGVYQRIDRTARIFDQTESFSVVNPAAAASPVTILAKDRLSDLESPRLIKQVFNIYNWRAELALGGQKLIYQGQHYTQKLDSLENLDVGNYFQNFDFFRNTHSNIKSTSHELRLQNEERIFGFLDYVVGVFDNKNDTPSNLTTQTPITLPAFLGGGVVAVVQTPVTRLGKSHEQSGFGNLTAHIGKSTELSGGLRYIDYSSTGSLIISGNVLPDAPIKTHKVIYSASAKHYFSRDFMVYASTGSSFRPGIDAIGDFSVAQSALEKSFLHLGPETSQSYEAGFKSTLMNGKMHFNLSAFHQKFNNYPYRAPGNGVYFVNYNATVGAGGVVTVTPQVGNFNFVAAVPVEVNGVEGEVNFDMSRRWKLGVVASYALGRIKKGTIPCNDLNGDGIPDNITQAPTLAELQAAVGANNISACSVSQRSAFQPPFSATLQSEYNLPISDKVDAYLRGLLTYFGKSQGDPTNAYDDVGNYGLLNLYAGVRDPHGAWEVSLFAKNLFDTTKVLTRTTPLSTTYQVLQPPTFQSAAASTYTSSYTGITMTPPREIGLTLRVSFGSR
jgi:iron complex outermembrane receptor protein